MSKHYHFIGIGGIGMSGLAHILLQRGFVISGSDPSTNKQTDDLAAAGATISHEPRADNITNDIDVVVTTSAIRQDNPEYVAAVSAGIQILKRSELLNEVLNEHKPIAVTGTHGKTTTASMLTVALTAAGLDPTAVIGAEVQTVGSNAKEGKGEYSVAEVCEYERAFLDVYPFGAIITNVEEDHLDCYKDIDDIVDAFTEFVSHIPKEGFLVYNGDDANTARTAKDAVCKQLSFGLGQSNRYVATDVVVSGHSTTFKVLRDGKFLISVSLVIPGAHNVLNALATVAVCDVVEADLDICTNALSTFSGADRRFQLKYHDEQITIIDDYAHHPTEIVATLKGVKQFYPHNRIVAVFQPHQHCRTKSLMQEFAKSFDLADRVFLPEIYAVRDTDEDIKNVSSAQLADLINQKVSKASYYKTFDETVEALRKEIKKGDVVITIGAGPVFMIGEQLSTFYAHHDN